MSIPLAYKIALGTMLFNTMFGPNANLSLEFLMIPTLRVAKELEWIGHELSQILDQLEQLNEVRLKAVAKMYAKKHRQKKFHACHIKNKEFKIGDLVLVYTIKQHASKLKKRGNEIYVIHDISTSGAVKLATFDNEQMLNWIRNTMRL